MMTTLDVLLSAIYLAVSTALFAAAVILAVRFHYRNTPRIRQNRHWFPPPPINYVLPQQPPPAHFYPPIPQRAPAVDEYPGIIHGRDEEDVPGEMEIGVQEGSNGDVARARFPYVQLSPSVSHHSSAGATPHPESNYPTAADLATDMGAISVLGILLLVVSFVVVFLANRVPVFGGTRLEEKS